MHIRCLFLFKRLERIEVVKVNRRTPLTPAWNVYCNGGKT